MIFSSCISVAFLAHSKGTHSLQQSEKGCSFFSSLRFGSHYIGTTTWGQRCPTIVGSMFQSWINHFYKKSNCNYLGRTACTPLYTDPSSSCPLTLSPALLESSNDKEHPPNLLFPEILCAVGNGLLKEIPFPIRLRTHWPPTHDTHNRQG